jgi:mycothiol system anti-sigma-R factor
MSEQFGADAAPASCDETIARLYVYLDGELTDDRREAIRQHLDECAPCLDIMGFETELRRVISDACTDRVPAELRIRIAALIEREANAGSAER